MVLKKHPKYIIGLTGPFGSGKSTAASFFKSKGYEVAILSKPLEEEAVRRNLPITRKNLQDIGNEWRKKFGSGILVKKAIEGLFEKDKVVIDGLRNIGEINEIRQYKNSLIIAVIADRKVRLNRLKNLKRREKLTKALFDQLDSRDLGIGEKDTGLQVAFCIALADRFIDSNAGLSEFKNKLEKLLDKYER